MTEYRGCRNQERGGQVVAERVYIRGKGKLAAVGEKAFGVEDDLQELIADPPDAIVQVDYRA